MDRLSELGPPPLWQVDRLLRNLLTDLTGNTHRAEFCIDKLYNPDSSSGRLGVLELRGFEMPPHPQMSSCRRCCPRARRAAVGGPVHGRARALGQPAARRFMLPWFLERDLELIVEDLRRTASRSSSSGSSRYLEFRFPRLGGSRRRRHAGAARGDRAVARARRGAGVGGTARYVDSSLQRLQVRVDGYVDDRHAVLCNGCLVPLAADRDRRHRGRGRPLPRVVAAVGAAPDDRGAGAAHLRAGRPAHRALARRLPLPRRPTPAAAPTTGCRSTPAEAEARRGARFEPIGHTPGEIHAPPVRRSSEYPRTLDLREAGYRRR